MRCPALFSLLYWFCVRTSSRGKLVALLLFSGICGQHAAAQEEFIPSPSKLITSMPFTTFTGGVVVIKALLGNYPDSLNFIMDTGSGGISLDSSTCVRLHIPTVASDRTIRGIGGIRKVRFVYNQRLTMRGLVADSLDFHVNDYEILSGVYGDHIDGIIGYSFFLRYIVKFDYDSSRMIVYSNGYMKYPKGGFLLRPVFVGLPIEPASIRDALPDNARFYFDTGAGLCLLLSSDFVADSNFLFQNKKVFMTQAEGLGGKANMKLTTIREMKLGPYKFKRVPTYIFDDEYNITSYPYLGGLIGNDILRRFNILLNYDRKEIYLVPNSHYHDPFDYSYTGLGMYWTNGQVMVGDVMKDSPADRAGLKVGDRVVSVGNNLSNNLQVYKNMLQNYGERIRIIVQRPGAGLFDLSIKVKSIL